MSEGSRLTSLKKKTKTVTKLMISDSTSKSDMKVGSKRDAVNLQPFATRRQPRSLNNCRVSAFVIY